jgi:hypothetical protein
MREQQHVVIVGTVARLPQRQHAFQTTLDAVGKSGTALAFWKRVARREPVRVPSRELVGVAFANLIGGESFEQSEVHLGEFVDCDKLGRVARDDSRAFGCANEWTREDAREIVGPSMSLDRAACAAHLRAPEFRQSYVRAAVIPDARLALGLAVANEDQPRPARIH